MLRIDRFKRVSAFPTAPVALAAALGLVLSAALCPSAANAQGFSTAEKQRLKSGKLVLRPEMKRQGQLKLIGGTSYQIINLPADSVWKAVTDFNNYRRFVPEAVESQVRKKRRQSTLLYLKHSQGPITIDYYMTMNVLESARMAHFKVDKTLPHGIVDGWGFFNIKPYGKDKTMVSFGILADIGDGLIAGVLREEFREWMLRTPNQLKKYVEGSGRKLYARRK